MHLMLYSLKHKEVLKRIEDNGKKYIYIYKDVRGGCSMFYEVTRGIWISEADKQIFFYGMRFQSKKYLSHPLRRRRHADHKMTLNDNYLWLKFFN